PRKRLRATSPRNHTTPASAPTVCRRSFRCLSLFRDVRRSVVGEWKAQISLRVRQALRAEMEDFAAREKRKLGNLGEVLLEWSFEQLKAAGSIDRLLRYHIRPSAPRGKERDKSH